MIIITLTKGKQFKYAGNIKMGWEDDGFFYIVADKIPTDNDAEALAINGWDCRTIDAFFPDDIKSIIGVE